MLPDFPADAWPAGNRLSWGDDSARLMWDFTTDAPTSRDYTDEENAAADAAQAAENATAARAELLERAGRAVAANERFLLLKTPLSTVALTAQVRALTQQMNVLIQLSLDDTTSPATQPRIGKSG